MTNTNEIRKELEKLIKRCAQCDKEPEVCTGCFYFVDQIMQLLAKHESEVIKEFIKDLSGFVKENDPYVRASIEKYLEIKYLTHKGEEFKIPDDAIMHKLTKNTKAGETK